MPPSTHCSAETSCGGVRSKASYGWAGAGISATLTARPPPRLRCATAAGTARPAGGGVWTRVPTARQTRLCARLWMACVNALTSLCTCRGGGCGHPAGSRPDALLTCDDAVTRLCTHIRPARRADVAQPASTWTAGDYRAPLRTRGLGGAADRTAPAPCADQGLGRCHAEGRRPRPGRGLVEGSPTVIRAILAAIVVFLI